MDNLVRELSFKQLRKRLFIALKTSSINEDGIYLSDLLQDERYVVVKEYNTIDEFIRDINYYRGVIDRIYKFGLELYTEEGKLMTTPNVCKSLIYSVPKNGNVHDYAIDKVCAAYKSLNTYVYISMRNIMLEESHKKRNGKRFYTVLLKDDSSRTIETLYEGTTASIANRIVADNSYKYDIKPFNDNGLFFNVDRTYVKRSKLIALLDGAGIPYDFQEFKSKPTINVSWSK